MANISNAYQWSIETCNAPNIGYSQTYRNQQVVGGITYYDCSSFIYYALIAGGFDLDPDEWPFTTYTMNRVLLNLGFQQIEITDAWLPGDILNANPSVANHCEMVYEGRRTMGAHSARYPLDDQVSINDTPSAVPGRWRDCFRWGSGASGKYEWINGGESEYFSLMGNEQKNNARCIYGFFFNKGWTLNAIAGLCGNIQQESTFNPNLIQIGGTGHGLVQWTPPENLYDVLDVLYGGHDDWYDGDKQCNAIYAEFEQSTGRHDWGIEPQWYQTSAYPISWDEWATSTADPGYLALAFERNYERPRDDHPERAQYARNWYDFLKGEAPWIPPINDTRTFRRMPFWMYKGFW